MKVVGKRERRKWDGVGGFLRCDGLVLGHGSAELGVYRDQYQMSLMKSLRCGARRMQTLIKEIVMPSLQESGYQPRWVESEGGIGILNIIRFCFVIYEIRVTVQQALLSALIHTANIHLHV